MEVIYTGLRQTPEQIVSAAMQEDVDVIAMSCLSGAHDYLFPRVTELLKEKGAADVLVLGGGIIPEEDVPMLKGLWALPISSLPGLQLVILLSLLGEISNATNQIWCLTIIHPVRAFRAGFFSNKSRSVTSGNINRHGIAFISIRNNRVSNEE